MTDCMQHNNKKVAYPVTNSLKVKLIKHFYNIVTKEMTDIGCHYFAHNLIKNREEPMMNSFSKNPGKHMKYWEDYWDFNSSNYESYTIRKK